MQSTGSRGAVISFDEFAIRHQLRYIKLNFVRCYYLLRTEVSRFDISGAA
jgi:hypothetical protein